MELLKDPFKEPLKKPGDSPLRLPCTTRRSMRCRQCLEPLAEDLRAKGSFKGSIRVTIRIL